MTKFIKVYLVFEGIKNMLETIKRQTRSRKMINNLGNLLVKFIIPLKRAKKSSELGAIMRVKM